MTQQTRNPGTPTSGKPRPINRLKTMYKIRAIQDENLKSTQEGNKEGRPVAWSMQEQYATPFFNAIGIDTVYPENYSSVTAAAGRATPFLERCEAEGFPNHVCGYAQACIGYAATMMRDYDGEIPPGAPQGGMPKPILLVSSGMGCDARFKWFEALGRYMDAPQWVIEAPMGMGKESMMEGAHEATVRFMVKELRDFAAFLERVVGRKIDWDKFEQDIDSQMEMNNVWWEVNETRKAVPGPMHSRDFWACMNASLFRARDPERLRGLYAELLEEVKDRVANKVAGINRPEKYRMTFVGLPPWHALDFFDQLADRGWNFVTEGSYHPPRPFDLSHISDPVERWVRYRNQGIEHQIDCNFPPDEAERIKAEIKRGGTGRRMTYKGMRDFKVEGAFLHPLLTCRTATAGLNLQAKQLMEVWKIPSLIIEGDIIDTRLFNREEALRKAEAFEETLDHYKKVRKEEMGLEW